MARTRRLFIYNFRFASSHQQSVSRFFGLDGEGVSYCVVEHLLCYGPPSPGFDSRSNHCFLFCPCPLALASLNESKGCLFGLIVPSALAEGRVVVIDVRRHELHTCLARGMFLIHIEYIQIIARREAAQNPDRHHAHPRLLEDIAAPAVSVGGTALCSDVLAHRCAPKSAG